jgi:hypothetical protein
MFYGKYDDDEPSLAQKIARELEKGNQDDEVRLTARYCNSGDYEGTAVNLPSGEGKTNPVKSENLSKPVNVKSFSEAKVGDYIEGLEELGKVVSISGPDDYKEPEPVFTDVKIAKFRKWLEKQGFEYQEEYKGQHSYWYEKFDLSVTTDPRFIIVNWEHTWFEDDEELFTNVKDAKKRIKGIVSQ